MAETEFQQINHYEDWLKSEGIPVVRSFFVEDVNALKVAPWPRTGGKGAYINFDACSGIVNSYLCEIPPGTKLEPSRHLYEEVVFVLKGRGSTAVWRGNGPSHSFDWSQNSLFATPLNTPYQHINSSTEPACFIAFTNAPMVINLFRNLDFVFRNPFDFRERFSSEEEYWTRRIKGIIGNRTVWQANLVHDLMSAQVPDLEERGKTGRAYYIMADSTLGPFLGVLPVGSYTKAHRHGPSAHILTLSGTGYTLLWKDGEEKQRVDWKPGSLVVPANGWWHQIFNTGHVPERSLKVALGGPGNLHPYGEMFWPVGHADQIEYEDEDPEIRRTFERELAKTGVQSTMPVFGKR